MSVRDGAKVAQALRDSILKLELRPGTILDEIEVANSMNVSRTPVREAIIQLVADRLVVREGRKAKVAPLDFDDVPKLYDALRISSRLVHRLAAENRTERDLKEIRRTMKAFEVSTTAGDGVLRSEANYAFHKAISAAADNRYVSAFYEDALSGTIRLARACFSSFDEFSGPNAEGKLKDHLAETLRQHTKIYEAIESKDVEAADALAVAHYELTRNRLLKVLFRESFALADVTDMSTDKWRLPALTDAG